MINSTSNKQVKRVINLQAKAKARREEGVYVAEGLRMCREFTPKDVEALYVTPSFESQKENREWLHSYSYEIVTEEVMKAMADTKTPQGVLAVARQKKYTLEELLKPASSGTPLLLMLLENIQDPGNLGTILRAGEGAGVTGVIMSRDTVDIYSPKVIRSTMGSVLRMPFLYTEDFTAVCKRLGREGVRLFAAHLKGMNNYDRQDYTGNVGFLIGNEANGLTEAAAEAADCCIQIPMAGKVESLNAAVAASVLMFEAARQRRNI